MREFFSSYLASMGLQTILALTTWLFMFLIPDIAHRNEYKKEDLWLRVYIDGILVVPLCILAKSKLNYNKAKGPVYGLILSGISLLLIAFSQSEFNMSPLLYLLIYRVLAGISWIHITFFTLTHSILSEIQNTDAIYSRFIASFILGTTLAPFIGYTVYKINYCLLFSLLGCAVLAYSSILNSHIPCTDELKTKEKNLLPLILYQKSISLLLITFSLPFISVSFLFLITMPYLDSIYSLPDMTLECMFLLFKVPLLVSCLLYPRLTFLIGKSKFIIGYSLSVIGYLLLIKQLNQSNFFILSVSLVLLGASSGVILSNIYTASPLSTLLHHLQTNFTLIYSPELVSQTLFFLTTLTYCCRSLGFALSAIVIHYSAYSPSFLILALLLCAPMLFLNHFIPPEASQDPKLIELTDIKLETFLTTTN